MAIFILDKNILDKLVLDKMILDEMLFCPKVAIKFGQKNPECNAFRCQSLLLEHLHISVCYLRSKHPDIGILITMNMFRDQSEITAEGDLVKIRGPENVLMVLGGGGSRK